MRKSIIFLTLLIPVLIAIVLKFFGSNHYDIPVYYENGIQKEDCNLNQQDQYYVAESEFGKNDLSWTNNTNLVYFNSELNSSLPHIQQELPKLAIENASDLNLRIWALGDGEKIDMNNIDITYIPLSKEQQYNISRCQLIIPDNLETIKGSEFGTIVMIDGKGRIRGYYNGGEQEEYDRLSAEIDILDLENKQ